MEPVLTHDAELNRLWSLVDEKGKEIAAIEKKIEKTKDTNEEIRLLRQGKQLLAEQRQLLEQIADRLEIIQQNKNVPNHEEKTAN